MVCRYHTGPGFFVNTYLVFLTVSASIWVYLLLALAGAQTFACPTKADPQKMCSTLTGAAAQPAKCASCPTLFLWSLLKCALDAQLPRLASGDGTTTSMSL